jgi:Sap, sulfolipid-1-addressing protein
MAQVIVSLLPLVIGASFGAPMWVVMTVLLLRGEEGTTKAAAFASGAMTIRVLQGIFFGYVFISALSAGGELGVHFMASTMLLMVGVLLLATVVKTMLKEEDPDAPPPRWMAILNRVTAPKAFGMGAVLMVIGIKQWVFTLSAIAVIDEAQLGLGKSVLAYLLFAFAAQSLVIVPIVLSALARNQSGKSLERLLRVLQLHGREITIVASLIFGVWFIMKGVSGLMEHGAGTLIMNIHE